MTAAAALEADVFRALADPTRRALFEQLARGESTVKDLTRAFEVSQPAISQHLASLRGCGLVGVRREGRFTYWRVEPAGLQPIVDWIEHYQAFWVDRLQRLKTLITSLEDE